MYLSKMLASRTVEPFAFRCLTPLGRRALLFSAISVSAVSRNVPSPVPLVGKHVVLQGQGKHAALQGQLGQQCSLLQRAAPRVLGGLHTATKTQGSPGERKQYWQITYHLTLPLLATSVSG